MTDKVYLDYIQDILNSIKEIEEFTEDLNFNDFIEDRKTINAVIRSLEIIGEATKNIPKSIRSNYPKIPWKSMTGMRDKLIHEYSGVNLEMVWETIKKDIPKVKPLIEKIEQEFQKKGRG